MSFFNKKISIFAMVIAFALVIIGCSSNEAADQPASEDENSSVEEGNGGGELVIGITTAEIPTLETGPSHGQEGYGFVGFQLYDGLTRWDATQGDSVAEIVPALAESYEVSEEDNRTWIFKLREDVNFHDGTHFNADAVIFNFDRFMKEDFEYYSPQIAAAAGNQIKEIESYEKIDEYTVSITTHEPYAFLDETVTYLLMGSPEAIKEHGENYVQNPSGTGPFKFDELEGTQSLIMVPNNEYWGNVPKLDRLILKAMPDAAARAAGILSGDLNWAEAPSPETIEQMEAENYQIMKNVYPQVWRGLINTDLEEFQDPRVRQAMNYAINREGLAEHLINELGTPATQFYYSGHPWFSDEAVSYTYDPEKAKELLVEAGYPDGFDTRFIIPISGSGSMWPAPMAEYIQQNLADVGINVEIDALEWQTFLTGFQTGFPDDRDAGVFAWGTASHLFSFYSHNFLQGGDYNLGNYSNPKFDELMNQAAMTFDQSERDSLIREASTIVVDEAPALYVVHNLNARVLHPSVHGFVQPQSWFLDFTSVWVE